MSNSRIAIPVLQRVSRTLIPRTARQCRAQPIAPLRVATPLLRSQFRAYSQEEKPSKIYTFKDVVALTESPSPATTLIDVREPSELQATGRIPGALNIPISSQPDSFFISAEEFEDRYGFERPSKDGHVVFYCKAGVRSRAAAELARQGGWSDTAEYKGSWLDWEREGGEVERK